MGRRYRRQRYVIAAVDDDDDAEADGDEDRNDDDARLGLWARKHRFFARLFGKA